MPVQQASLRCGSVKRPRIKFRYKNCARSLLHVPTVAMVSLSVIKKSFRTANAFIDPLEPATARRRTSFAPPGAQNRVFPTFFNAHLIPWIYTYLYPFFTLKVPKSSMARSVPPGEQDDCDDTESQKSTIGVNDKCEEPSDEDEESSSGDEPEGGSGSQGKPSAEEMRKIWKKKKAMRQ